MCGGVTEIPQRCHRALLREGWLGRMSTRKVKLSSHESANKNHLETRFCCYRIIICAKIIFLISFFLNYPFWEVCKHFLFILLFWIFLCWLFLLNTAALKIWNITNNFHICVFPLSSQFIFPSKSHCRHNFNVNSSKASALLLMICFPLLMNVGLVPVFSLSRIINKCQIINMYISTQ